MYVWCKIKWCHIKLDFQSLFWMWASLPFTSCIHKRVHYNLTGDKHEAPGPGSLCKTHLNILPKQIFTTTKNFWNLKCVITPHIHNAPPLSHPSLVYLSPAKIFHLVYGTGGLNLHSQLQYAASSYILHANETINTPTHLSEASPCQGVKHCAVPHYRSLTALQLFYSVSVSCGEEC